MSVKPGGLLILTLVSVATTALLPTVARSEERFVNVALIDPVQIFDHDVTIRGLRLNMIYGVNRGVYGLDLGLANRVNGEAKGLQYGLVNMVHGPFTGWQNGAGNLTKGKFTGLGTGFYNGYGDAEGFVWGVVNVTGHM